MENPDVGGILPILFQHGDATGIGIQGAYFDLWWCIVNKVGRVAYIRQVHRKATFQLKIVVNDVVGVFRHGHREFQWRQVIEYELAIGFGELCFLVVATIQGLHFYLYNRTIRDYTFAANSVAGHLS